MCSTVSCNLMLHKWFRKKQRKNCNDKMDLPKCFEFWFFRMTDDYQFKLYLQTFYAYKENSPPICYLEHNNTFWNKWFGFALFCHRPIVANPEMFRRDSIMMHWSLIHLNINTLCWRWEYMCILMFSRLF